jgi:hypothetical protein
MSYREKLLKLPKKYKSKYENLFYDELSYAIKADNDGGFINLPEDTDLLTLSYKVDTDFPFLEVFFNNIDIKSESETRYSILTKEGLKTLIESYSDNVQSLIEQEIKDLECTDINDSDKVLLMISQLRNKQDHWQYQLGDRVLRPYKLVDENNTLDDMSDGQIVSHGSVNYQIFNLVFIYNTFDWDSDYLILNGW